VYLCWLEWMDDDDKISSKQGYFHMYYLPHPHFTQCSIPSHHHHHSS
jgi:hypothetical protein